MLGVMRFGRYAAFLIDGKLSARKRAKTIKGSSCVASIPLYCMDIVGELPPISWTKEMGGFFMSGRPLYDAGVRRRAVELYEEGHGRDVIAYLVGAPREP